MAEIVLFGASGFTGALVAERLNELGMPFAIAGRDSGKLQPLSERLGGVPVYIADAANPRTLDALMNGTRVLINCAGPFLRLGEPVVNAAVENGVHYIDTTGEQTWMKRILNRYDGVALRNGVTVINALAFEYAIGDWLTSIAAEKLGRGELIDSISIGYSLSGGGVSQGTALSIFEMMGEKGWSYEAGQWRRRPAGWTMREMPFPGGSRQVTWLPFGETLMVPRHEQVQTVLTYGRLPKWLLPLLPLGARGAPVGRAALRPLVNRFIARRSAGPTIEARQRSKFALVAEARRGGQTATATATGHDPYGITARVTAMGAQLLLAESVQRGVRSPSHLPVLPALALEQLGVDLQVA